MKDIHAITNTKPTFTTIGGSISMGKTVLSNGEILCEFSRGVKENNMFDLSKPLHLLYAWGNTISGSGYPSYHGIDGTAKYTGGKITMAPALVRV